MHARLMLSLASLALLGACQSEASPLPPPPIASYGNEGAAFEPLPDPTELAQGPRTRIAEIDPSDLPRDTQPMEVLPPQEPGLLPEAPPARRVAADLPVNQPYRVAADAPRVAPPSDTFAAPGTDYADPGMPDDVMYDSMGNAIATPAPYDHALAGRRGSMSSEPMPSEPMPTEPRPFEQMPPARMGPSIATPRAPGPQYQDRPFQWHTTLAMAQEDARAQGKLILVLATKPACPLCEQFRLQTLPMAMADVQRVAVGYTYDVTRPERADIDQIVRRNLGRARLMPLGGFMTSELRWLNGFWGKRTLGQLTGDIARVQLHVPRSSGNLGGGQPHLEQPYPGESAIPYGQPAPDPYGGEIVVDAGAPLPGLGDPGFIDAGSMGTGFDGGAAGDAGLRDGMGFEDTGYRDTGFEPVAEAPLPDIGVPGTSALPSDGTGGAFDGVMAGGAADGARPWMPDMPDVELPGAPKANAKPTAPLPADVAAAADDWERRALSDALSQIRGKRYAAAQRTLKQLSQRSDGTPVGREAAKGSIAIYNAKRMDQATSATERERFRQRAARDLRGTMWSSLFTG